LVISAASVSEISYRKQTHRQTAVKTVPLPPATTVAWVMMMICKTGRDGYRTVGEILNRIKLSISERYERPV